MHRSCLYKKSALHSTKIARNVDFACVGESFLNEKHKLQQKDISGSISDRGGNYTHRGGIILKAKIKGESSKSDTIFSTIVQGIVLGLLLLFILCQ